MTDPAPPENTPGPPAGGRPADASGPLTDLARQVARHIAVPYGRWTQLPRFSPTLHHVERRRDYSSTRRQGRRIDLHIVAGLIEEHGVITSLEHTGGGVATLLVGDQTDHPDFGGVQVLALGPGVFEDVSPGVMWAFADPADLYLGPDWGGTAGAPAITVPAWATEFDIAAITVAALRVDSRPAARRVALHGQLAWMPDWQIWLAADPDRARLANQLASGIGDCDPLGREHVACIVALITAAATDAKFGEQVSSWVRVETDDDYEALGARVHLQIGNLTLPIDPTATDLDPTPAPVAPDRAARILTAMHAAIGERLDQLANAIDLIDRANEM